MQIYADRLADHLQRELRAGLHGVGRRAAAGAGGGRRDPRRRARRRLQRAPGAHRRRRALRLEQPARRVAGAEPVRRPPAGRDPHPVGQARQGRLGGAAALLRDRDRRRRPRRRHAGAAAAARPIAAVERLVRRARPRRHHGPRRSGRAQGAAGVDRPAPGGAGPARRRRRRGASATLAFFADRVEGNLLAAHQEIQKLALLYPAGELGFEQIEARSSTSPATTSFKPRRGGARRPGGARAAHARRPARRGRGGGARALDAGRGHPRPEARQGRARAPASRCRWRCARRASGAPRSASSSAPSRC